MLRQTRLTALLIIMTSFCMALGAQADNLFAKKGAVAVEKSPIDGVTFRYIKTNGITMRIAEMGDKGPLVLMVHGWPESWYSWRHQIPALATAGYRVVVPDMRGYGKTDAPADVNSYDITTLAADMAGVLDALGEEQAIMVGHDWGAIVAAHSVLLHPERFSSLIIMSVPYRGRGRLSPIPAMKARTGDNFFYMLYHNEAGGVAEAEYDSDPRGILSRLYLSPDSPREEPAVTNPLRSAGGWIPRLGAAKGLPDWLEQQDLDYLVEQFEATGFRGGVNYYRNIERNWETTEHLVGAKIEVPTLFIAGEKDIVIRGATKPMLEAMMATTIPNLHDVVLVPEMGHWIQQEAPQETNRAMINFLKTL
ncbi:MAG: alpha/beta hydrolase [Oceanicoccus sp.]